MNTTRKCKGSWLVPSMVAAIIIAEVAAWELANLYGFQTSPILAAFLFIGIVVAIGSVLYEDVNVG